MILSLGPGCGVEVSSTADLDSYLAAVASAGFSAVSLNLEQLSPLLADDEEYGLRAAAKMLAGHGLMCTDVMTLTVRGQQRDEVSAAKRMLNIATALGASTVLTICYTSPTAAVIDRIGTLADMATRSGVTLALEFAPELPIHSIPTALALLAEVGSPSLGLTVDTWHFFRGGSTWSDLESVPLPDVTLVQFDDALPTSGGSVIDETTNRRTWPGLGEFDLGRFAATLRGRNWDGIVSVEVLSSEARLLDARDFAQTAIASSTPYWPN